MKVKFRRGTQDDLDQVYDLHTKCFVQTDQWYKSAIKHFIDNGILIETGDNKIIGVMLQGPITPCNKKFSSCDESNTDLSYKEDIFDPINQDGKMMLESNLQYKELYGIVMICVDPEYRGKGLAKKLIEKHFIDSKANNKIVCLNTRRSNFHAFLLYKKMGYEHVAFIRNKYFLPTEDSIFMIKDFGEN